jgi:hypothetical protein
MYSIRVRDLKIMKLTDEGGQYLLILQCECGHTRRCYPHTLAALAGGWEVNLADVVRRCAVQNAIRKNAQRVLCARQRRAGTRTIKIMRWAQ